MKWRCYVNDSLSLSGVWETLGTGRINVLHLNKRLLPRAFLQSNGNLGGKKTGKGEEVPGASQGHFDCLFGSPDNR